MTECMHCKKSAEILFKLSLPDGEKSYLLCKGHSSDSAYEHISPILVEKIVAKEEPIKFQSEVARLAQEMITN